MISKKNEESNKKEKNKSNLQLSSYQQDILDYFQKNPHNNMYIEAKAGSGKSSTILEMTKTTTSSDVYLAFNNSIVQEFKHRITNPKTKVYTTYSLAYAIMNANLSGVTTSNGGLGSRRATESITTAKLDQLKIHKIVDDLLTDRYGKRMNFEKRVFLKENYVQLYTSCRLTRTKFDSFDDRTKYGIDKIVEDHNLFMDMSENSFEEPDSRTKISMLQEIDRESIKEFDNYHVIDFTDMLYITCLKLASKEWSVPYWLLFTNIYCDECLPSYTLIDTDCGYFTIKELYLLFNNPEVPKDKMPKVRCFDEQKYKEAYGKIVNVVYKGKKDVYEIKTKRGTAPRKIVATENHKFYTNTNKWIPVSELIPESKGLEFGRGRLYCDKIAVLSKKQRIAFNNVIDIKKLEEQEDVYDIEVDEYHTFLATLRENDEYPFVVHNCQDFNNLQLNFIRYIKRQKGRYVFVLDEHQAIYAFNSANASSCRLIKKAFAPVQEFDLPICYRCPTSHLEKVRREFNINILPRPDAPQGDIKTIEKKEISNYARPGDMIISRKNKWLADVIIDLAIHGIPICIEDKELVDNVKKILRQVDCGSASVLKTKLDRKIKTFRNNLKTTMELNGQLDNLSPEAQEHRLNEISSTNARIDYINFILTILKHYLEDSPNSSKETFENFINKLLNTEYASKCVKLCSIHKAKGLEADNVFVLNEAKVTKDFRNSPEQQTQEYNLSYISITRAKNTLYLVKED